MRTFDCSPPAQTIVEVEGEKGGATTMYDGAHGQAIVACVRNNWI